MANDYEEKRKRAYANRRSLMDLGMGIIYAVVGGFLFLADRFGMEFPTKPFSYIFGALCLVYGGFRIYRGLKRNYFN